MKKICAFKIAVEHVKESTFGNSILIRPKQKITQFGIIKDIGFMAKKSFPELEIGDTVVCDYDGARMVDGLCVISPFEIVCKVEDKMSKLYKITPNNKNKNN